MCTGGWVFVVFWVGTKLGKEIPAEEGFDVCVFVLNELPPKSESKSFVLDGWFVVVDVVTGVEFVVPKSKSNVGTLLLVLLLLGFIIFEETFFWPGFLIEIPPVDCAFIFILEDCFSSFVLSFFGSLSFFFFFLLFFFCFSSSSSSSFSSL